MDFVSTIIEHGQYVVPLHSIDKNNQCCCGSKHCSSSGKHPLHRFNWKKTAEAAPKQVQKLFSEAPFKHNLGLLTGRRSSQNHQYLIVIDVDQTTEETEGFLKQLPNTFSYQTGKGRHFWFWSKQLLSNSVSRLAPGVDVRGKNGYVVIPPSKHASGSYYSLDEQSNQEIAPLPEFIVEMNKKPAAIKNNRSNKFSTISTVSKRPKKTWLLNNPSFISACLLRSYNNKLPVNNGRNVIVNDQILSKIPYGQRNVVLHKLLSWHRMKGADKKQLLQWGKKYRNCCENIQSFPMVEVTRIVNSVVQYPAFNNKHEQIHEQLKSTYFMRLVHFHGVRKINKKYQRANQQFFSSCLEPKTKQQLKGKKLNVGIKQVYKAWKAHMKYMGFVNGPGMTYQMLSRMLKQEGFERLRRKNGNFWNASIQPISVQMRRKIQEHKKAQQQRDEIPAVLSCALLNFVLCSYRKQTNRSLWPSEWPSERLEYSTGPPIVFAA